MLLKYYLSTEALSIKSRMKSASYSDELENVGPPPDSNETTCVLGEQC